MLYDMSNWFAPGLLEFYTLKVQSCKLFNKKYMIDSTQITNTEIFAFIALQFLS